MPDNGLISKKYGVGEWSGKWRVVVVVKITQFLAPVPEFTGPYANIFRLFSRSLISSLGTTSFVSSPILPAPRIREE